MEKAELGDKVKDAVTGFEGIMIARTSWLNGCDRLTVQSQEMKDGVPSEAQCFDEMQIEVLEKGVVKSQHVIDKERSEVVYEEATSTPVKGGPRPSPTRRPDPTR